MSTPDRYLAAGGNHRNTRWPAQAEPPMPLSERQLACLRLVAEGLRHADIATQLHISARVVRADIGAAIHRLRARNTMHAVGIAYRAGLLGADTEQVALVRLAERMGYRIALVPFEQPAR